jgi:uncharacterized protein (UPF0335 family)
MTPHPGEHEEAVVSESTTWIDHVLKLEAEKATLVEALDGIYKQAKSWHEFHHGSDFVQCDAICAEIPKMESALALAKGGK